MHKYIVKVTENIDWTYEVQAENDEDARQDVEAYWQGDGDRPNGRVELAECEILSVTRIEEPR